MPNKMTIRATFMALCTMLSVSAFAIADAPKPVDIPAGELSVALLKLSKQYGADLVYRPEQVHGLKTHGAHGSLTTAQAVIQLIQGTPLELRTDPSGAMLIAPPVSTGGAGQSATQSASSGSLDDKNSNKEAGKKSSQDFRMAQVDQNGVGPQAVNNQNSGKKEEGLSEIIVTAQKRNERLQDVPVPVTAISADDLIASNRLRLQDYFTSVPGLSVAPTSQFSQLLTIRGVTTGAATSPTVGITVDDVPYGPSTGLGGSNAVPDLDPDDLAQVEVLRGPQGTLYGASSLGGLLKFVTRDPSSDALSGRLQVGTSSVHNGAEMGYNVRGSINIPLSDTLAIRASGFTREDPGYIDNPVLGIDGVNEQRVSGGRLSALWKPTEAISLKLSSLYQLRKSDGASDVDVQPGLGDLQQNYIRGVGASKSTMQANSATLTAKIGGIDLVVLSGYNVNSFNASEDYSSLIYGTFAQSIFGVNGAPLPEYNKTKKFTQEVRLSAPIGDHFDWILGGFYTHEDSLLTQGINAEDPATGAIVGNLLNLQLPSTYSEYAGFADLTYKVSDRFDVQIGGRESQIKQANYVIESGALVGNVPITTPPADTKGSAFTYLVTPRFKLSPDLMLYARLASGYRAGGSNSDPGGPPKYDPDKTQNYEVGAKGDFLDHRISIDASMYYIDWKNIQIQVTDPVTHLGYFANAGEAKSQGLELSVEAKPLTGLTIAAWVAWNDAVLKQGFPSNSAVSGVADDRLPFSSRFSGNLSVEQRFPVATNISGYVGASLSYVGVREGVFTVPSLQRASYPAYVTTDLRGGFRHGSWSAAIFASNLADRRGVLYGGNGSDLSFAYQYLQPRTIGLSLAKEF